MTQQHLRSAEHFSHEHYLCEDAICRQEQFRVFATEAELNQHRAKEHGNVMSGYERRQAMRVPIELNVSISFVRTSMLHTCVSSGCRICLQLSYTSVADQHGNLMAGYTDTHPVHQKK